MTSRTIIRRNTACLLYTSLKPFSLKELDARIIAHLKREERLHRKKEQRFYGELVIDYASKCVQDVYKRQELSPRGITEK